MELNLVKVMIVFLVAIVLGLAGCDGSSGQNTTQTPPAISNLQYTPTSMSVNTLTSVNWQFDFTDTGGDITTDTYTVYDPSGLQVATKTINLTIPAGTKAGTQFGTTSNIPFLTVGTYTVDVYVTDSAGYKSNTLTVAFTIVP